jgi:lysophospholipase L1-like esterase
MPSSLRSISPALSALCGLVLALPTLAQQAAPPAGAFKPIVDKIDLTDGDSLVFLGDSITHQCLYTQYVEDYFYTRRPKLHIHFHNAGVGGDRASNALARFDDDVAAYKPKYVTILLGMNDGGYTRYEQPIFDTYQKDMNTVLDKIAALGATAVPMTPTMHDARAARIPAHGAEPRDTYYNGVLALYGAWLREQAQVRGLGFVDMWGPLNHLTLEQRKKDANWTMIKDAVHPSPVGHAIMAAAILDDMVAHSPVSTITVDQKQGEWSGHAAHGKLGELQKTEKGVTFAFTASSLPWVLPPDATEGVRLGHLPHRLSAEKITIADLAPGKYDLEIDGQTVGTYTEEQLAAGVALEENEKTPEYQQALTVATLNKKRNDQAVHPLRDQWALLKNKRRDLEKAQQANAPDLADKQAAFDAWYATFPPAVKNLEAKVQEFEDQIYQINQPQTHQYEIARSE